MDEDEEKEIVFDRDDSAAEASEEFMKAYQRWNREHKALNEDLIRHEEIKKNCRKQANKQHDEDADACNHLQSALISMKKYLQGMVKKLPFLEDIVRQKRKDGIDPYDDNDMRSCYENLLNRYRQSDEMGILTTIMSGMAEKQGSKSMSGFLLAVEDWHQTMIRLGVQSISMSDLAAIITLKGMNESHRIEFLQQENALALTLENLENDEESMGETSDDEDQQGSLTTTNKKEKKSLLMRVKKFIQQDKNKTLINQRFSSTGAGGNSNVSANSSQNGKREAEQRLREAQNVFIATLDTDVCKFYAKNGHCRFGDKCKHKHEETILNKRGYGGGGKSGQNADNKPSDDYNTKSVQQECFSWRDHGTCKFGDACKFVHKSSSSSHRGGGHKGGGVVNNVQESSSNTYVKSSHSNGGAGSMKDSSVSTALFTLDDNSGS